MKPLAKKLSRLGNETAFRVLTKAQALEKKGVNVIHLEIGEPDFNTPTHIIDAACKAMNEGLTHYTGSQGITPLREEIAGYIKETRGLSVNPDCVVITPGAKPIIFYTILSLLEDGDEAIYPNPGFPIYESMINFSGAKAVAIPLREEIDFRLDIDELRSKITPRTKLIILNSPENPTGGVLAEKDLRAIAEIALEHDIYVLSDEVYEYIIYEGEMHSISSIPGMFERTILMNGFSKTYAMTGWRIGYGILPARFVEAFLTFIGNSVSCTSTFTQYACIKALSGPQDGVTEMVNEFRARRDIMVNGLNSIPGISCRKTAGAFYAFPNITRLGISSSQLANYLLDEAGVACLAGSDFGHYGEGYLRLSYANSQDNIREAICRIEKAVSKLK